MVTCAGIGVRRQDRLLLFVYHVFSNHRCGHPRQFAVELYSKIIQSAFSLYHGRI